MVDVLVERVNVSADHPSRAHLDRSALKLAVRQRGRVVGQIIVLQLFFELGEKGVAEYALG
jgi:hypothetical protein